jgi:uncharacterized protein
MRLVWDESKRQRNIETHGLDFRDLLAFEWTQAAYKSTYRGRFGNARHMATGRLGEDLVTIVFARLGTEAFSIVSFRRASQKERRDYENSQANP